MQSLKTIKQALEAAMSQATTDALALIKSEAKAAMGADSTIQSFCMAMGSASFHVVRIERDEDGESWTTDEHLDPDELPENVGAQNVGQILYQLNGDLCLTGWPMRITRDHVTGEFITANDW